VWNSRIEKIAVGGYFTLRPILEELHACRDAIWRGRRDSPTSCRKWISRICAMICAKWSCQQVHQEHWVDWR
jgi:hypothetical protein